MRESEQKRKFMEDKIEKRERCESEEKNVGIREDNSVKSIPFREDQWAKYGCNKK